MTEPPKPTRARIFPVKKSEKSEIIPTPADGAFGDRPHRMKKSMAIEMRAAFQREAPKSLATLIEIRDNGLDEKARASAAVKILEFALGKPVQQIQAEIGKPGDFDQMQTEEEILQYISVELGAVASKGIKMIVDQTTKNKIKVNGKGNKKEP